MTTPECGMRIGDCGLRTDTDEPSSASDTLLGHLRAACAFPLAVVGVGNPMRGDDGFGPAVVAALPQRDGMAAFDAGMAPENWLGPIARANPRAILVVDAAGLDEPPGTLRLLRADELESVGASTHGLPLGFFLTMAEQRCGAPAHLLAVQPQSMGLGDPMAQPVRAAVGRVVAAIARLASPTSQP